MNEQPDDKVLLRAYTSQGDDSAFAELMRRHGGLVRAAARNVVGAASTADDIAQATFLALARKARSLCDREGSLAGWLYRVATYLARDARRDEFRRTAREKEVAMLAVETDTDTSPSLGEAALAALCEELGNLAEKYRQPVILHHLQGLSYETAAPMCGCNGKTFSMRLTRGREKLRERLAKRGVTLGAAALVAGLSQSAASAAELPAALVASTCKAATAVAAGGSVADGGLVSAKVAALTDSALKLLFWGQVKTVAAVCAGIAVLGGTAVTVATLLTHPPQPEARQAAVVAPVLAVVSNAAAPAEAGVMSAGVAVAQAVDTGAPAETNTVVLVDYVRLKHKQMESAAAAAPFRVHEAFPRLFRGMETGDAIAISNAYTFIRPRIGQYEARPGDPAPDPDLNNPAWQYVLDAHGAWGEFSLWTAPSLRTYANDILNSIPSNAVLFAGTDPGRFVLSAFNGVAGTNGVLIVTQNALADNLYLDYARRLYGDRMSLPAQADSANAFQIYAEEVKSGKRPKNAEVEVKDGRIAVNGAAAVMEINGILARMIFERNKDNHQFFVEESYVIPWMYPFLTPHGLILRLNSEPTSLTAAMVAEDHAFWARYEEKLRSQATFGADIRAQKTYSKLRSAMGGVYAFRGRFDDAEKAFMQARRLFPESPEVNYRLVQDVLLRQNRFAEALRVMNQYRDILPSWVRICAKEGEAVELRTEQDKVDRMIEYIKTLEAQQGTGTWQQKTQGGR